MKNFLPYLLSLSLLAAGCGHSETRGRGPAQYLEAVRNDPVRLEQFVREIPKGGDIHSHLSGIPYAESYLKWAAEDGACINTATWQILAAPCADGSLPVAAVIADPLLYNRAIDGLSMRNFPLEPPRYGHDHFFSLFSRFGLISATRKADMLAEAATRAAADRTDYLELLITFQSEALGRLVERLPWTGDLETDYPIFAAGVQGLLDAGQAEIADLTARQRAILGCDGEPAAAACGVGIGFIQQANRTSAPQWVFASLIFGAEMAARQTAVLGVDLVSPEDHPQALANCAQHMEMLAFLKKKYPGLKISLHAGELNSSLAAPEDLGFHITRAVRTAGANRIAHGVSLKNEPGWQELLEEMAAKQVGIAILLTSNAQILGVQGEAHPFLDYLDAGVPVTLGSDDQGVSRGSHTAEYVRAIRDYGLTWAEVKRLVRTSLEQSFARGGSLWAELGDEPRPVEACRDAVPGEFLSPGCAAYLQANARAALQWRLEERLHTFAGQYR